MEQYYRHNYICLLAMASISLLCGGAAIGLLDHGRSFQFVFGYSDSTNAYSYVCNFLVCI